MSRFHRNSNVDSARVIEVLEITSIVGEGTKHEPVRQVVEYFSPEGKLLARHDAETAFSLGVWHDDEVKS